MSSDKTKLGIVGVGKIVRDQHLPAITKNGSFDLIATASRNASVDGIAAYITIEEMLEAVPTMQAVALCMPPQYRYQAASLALQKGLHVLLEKPPGATVSEVEQLGELATSKRVSLYATWHSRHAASVEKAKHILAESKIQSVKIDWKEDVRKWHPNQEWIWQAGGLGVFDPGINGLSILTEILPEPIFLQKSLLTFPVNKSAPIAAKMMLNSPSNIAIEADFDWRLTGDEAWNIEVETSKGVVQLMNGGSSLKVDGRLVEVAEHSEHSEYEAIYARFARMIQNRQSDLDLAPLKLVADAFLMGERFVVEAFQD